MPKLVKRMPRFARKVPAQRYSAPIRGDWWMPAFGQGYVGSGIASGPLNALLLPAFAACVRVISEDLASLPIGVYRYQDGKGTRYMPDHDITWRFASSPDGEAREMSSFQWREAWISHCLTRGNGYAEIETSNGGDLLGLHLMDPNCTEEYRDTRDKRLQYRTEGNKYLPAYRVLHLAMPGGNGISGYSPSALLRDAIGLGKAAELFGASLFGNGAVPKGLLKYPGKLSPEAKENLRISWNEKHRGGASNNVAVLEQGLEWVNTQVNPDEAQFLDTRQFQVIEVARLFRVPPHKIGDYSQSHLANIEAANLDYLMTTLRPWCQRIEECLGLKLLSDSERRRGYLIRHDIRDLLRASIKDRALYYQAMFQFGMSPNEIFDLEDMNPIPDEDGGNKRFRTVNTVDLNAETPAPTPPRAPGDGQDQPQNAGKNRLEPSKNGRFSHENGEIP